MHLTLKLERGNEGGLFMEAKSQSGWWECPEQSFPSENWSLQGLPTSSFPTVYSHWLGAVGSVCMLSCVWLFAIPWMTLAHQFPLSMKFSRQKYWVRLPLSTPGDLPNQGTESESLVSLAFSRGFFFSPLHHLGSPQPQVGCLYWKCSVISWKCGSCRLSGSRFLHRFIIFKEKQYLFLIRG